MADNKKYYYLKLKDDFYESEEMILLQNMPDGYLYSDILLKLYLRSLKNEGKLMFKGIIPYTPEVLAQVVRHQVGTVEKALSIFQKLGLIEVLDDGAIYMLDIQNFIGKSSTEADRIRTYRTRIDKEKKIGCTNVQQKYDKCTPEIEKEKEIEIDTEIEKDIEDTPAGDAPKPKKETFANLIKGYTENPELITALEAFVEMRKKMKGFTTYALKLALGKLDKLASDDASKTAIVNQSIERGWRGFFELKQPKKKTNQEIMDAIIKGEMSFESEGNDDGNQDAPISLPF